MRSGCFFSLIERFPSLSVTYIIYKRCRKPHNISGRRAAGWRPMTSLEVW
jgi:hypothetical protein